jgi:multiple sugar transport system substrate-binding protein
VAKEKAKEISRRDFIKLTAASALAVGTLGTGPFFLFPERAHAQQKTLKVLQWKHFVPEYDEWFDGIFAKQWGQKHDTKVLVDHVPLEEINSRAAAEVGAHKGHDLVMFASPPASFEKQVIDQKDVYQEVQSRHGQMILLAHKSTFNPKTNKHFAFADSYIPAPALWLMDCWRQIGLPFGPTDFGTMRMGAKQILEEFGIPCGLGLGPDLATNVAMRAVLWSFGGFVQDADGNVTINSKGTIEALKYMRALYQESETPEVLTWDNSSNVRAMLAEKISLTVNSISLVRQAERENPETAKRIMASPSPKGPGHWLAIPHLTSCYVIWDFAENKEGAQQFLIELIDNFKTAFRVSGCCNFPTFPSLVSNLIVLLKNDPKAEPHYKYMALEDTLHWTRNLGYPGYATPAIEEVFNAFVIPKMFAVVAKGDLNPEGGAAAAEKEIKRIFKMWERA